MPRDHGFAMTPLVLLDDIVDSVEMSFDESPAFFDLDTAQVVQGAWDCVAVGVERVARAVSVRARISPVFATTRALTHTARTAKTMSRTL